MIPLPLLALVILIGVARDSTLLTQDFAWEPFWIVFTVVVSHIIVVAAVALRGRQRSRLLA